MELFLDTANIDDITRLSQLGIIDGVTTNPSLIAKEKASYRKRLKEICKVISGPVSGEVVSTDYTGMVSEGLALSKVSKNLYVKLPLTSDGLQACHTLSQKGIKINMTLIFSTSQALLAAKAGATLISPFEGRLDDISWDGGELISEIAAVIRNGGFNAKILAASIRDPRAAIEAAIAGADIATVPVSIFEKMIAHPLTDIGLKRFSSDWKKAKITF